MGFAQHPEVHLCVYFKFDVSYLDLGMFSLISLIYPMRANRPPLQVTGQAASFSQGVVDAITPRIPVCS